MSEQMNLPSLSPDQNKVSSSQGEEDRKRKAVTWVEGIPSCISTSGVSSSSHTSEDLDVLLVSLALIQTFPSCLLHGSDDHLEFRHLI